MNKKDIREKRHECSGKIILFVLLALIVLGNGNGNGKQLELNACMLAWGGGHIE